MESTERWGSLCVIISQHATTVLQRRRSPCQTNQNESIGFGFSHSSIHSWAQRRSHVSLLTHVLRPQSSSFRHILSLTVWVWDAPDRFMHIPSFKRTKPREDTKQQKEIVNNVWKVTKKPHQSVPASSIFLRTSVDIRQLYPKVTTPHICFSSLNNHPLYTEIILSLEKISVWVVVKIHLPISKMQQAEPHVCFPACNCMSRRKRPLQLNLFDILPVWVGTRLDSWVQTV